MLNQKIRYQAIIKMLQEKQYDSVCEIGSGSQGLGKYLPNIEFTGVDQDFLDYGLIKKRHASKMTPIQMNAKKLPFKDDSFDFVFALDMFEHVPVADRSYIINEMIRISKCRVVIGFPCGMSARMEDEKYAKKLKRLNLTLPGWLMEHITIPYPMQDEVENILKELNYVVQFKSFWNENLQLHRFIQWFEFLTLGYSHIDFLLPFFLIKFLDNHSGGAFFRKFYVIDKK